MGSCNLKMSLTIATILVSILCLLRISLLVIFLVLTGGHVTSLTLTLLSVVRGLMTFIDIVTIIGAIKRNKTILIFWILFAMINMAVDIYRGSVAQQPIRGQLKTIT